MAVNYSSSSAYAMTPVVDNMYLDIMKSRKITMNANDVFYEVPSAYNYRPDLLAQDLYGNSQLWWVFAARNPNTLGASPIFNFVTGVQIYIPTLSQLKTDLGI